MTVGKQLIAEIDAWRATDRELAVWWLGQHGFVLKIGRTVIYVDAYLSPHPQRQAPGLLQPNQVTNADLVLGTHDHGDHIDRAAWPGIAAASSQAVFVVPDLLRDTLAAELAIPPRRVLGVDDGRSVTVCGITITGVAAAHEFLDRDAASGRYPYLGYVIEGHGRTIYHAGDTCRYEGLETTLKRWAFDVAFLPINGRDAARLAAHCIGNMTYQEAADLAGALQPGLTVPAHYDMFAGNSLDPTLFADYMRVKYPRLAVCVCRRGERVIVPA